MFCPRCGSELPAGATYCTQCAAVVDPVDHVIKTVGRVAKDVIGRTSEALDRASKAIEPAVDRTVKAIRPAVEETAGALKPVAQELGRAAKDLGSSVKPAAEKAVKATREAAQKAAKAAGPPIEKTAAATERAARTIKEKVRKRSGR